MHGSDLKMARTWPPPKGDDDDDDDEDACQACKGSSFNFRLAVDAYYEFGFSLRDSWCIGRSCSNFPDEEDTEDEDEEEEIESQSDGKTEVMTRGEEVSDKDLNKNSTECPPSSPTEYSVSSLYLSPGWGLQLPPPVKQVQKSSQWKNWRPWNTEEKTVRTEERKEVGRTEERRTEERRTEAGNMDLNRNSSECPSFLPTTVSPPLNLTPVNPSVSQSYSPPIISKGPVRRIWKRYRSPEELAKRRKRKHDYLLRQQPATPHMQPDTLETYARCEVGVARMLDWSRVDERGDKSVGWASPPPQWSQQLVSPSPPCFPHLYLGSHLLHLWSPHGRQATGLPNLPQLSAMDATSRVACIPCPGVCRSRRFLP